MAYCVNLQRLVNEVASGEKFEVGLYHVCFVS